MNLLSLDGIRKAITKLLSTTRNQQLESATFDRRISALELEVRDLRIVVLHLSNLSQVEIAKLSGLSKGRVSQIIKNYTEQTFGKGAKNGKE